LSLPPEEEEITTVYRNMLKMVMPEDAVQQKICRREDIWQEGSGGDPMAALMSHIVVDT
jgi:hypothetical protein